MTALVGLPFHLSFAFARSVTGAYHNAAGAPVTAAVDEPRFDHGLTGLRRGLLIEGAANWGEHDSCHALGGDWEVSGPATVLAEWEGAAGIERRALYSVSVRATINACCMIAGHLRTIGALSGFLPNLDPGGEWGGYVRYRNLVWPLGNALSADGGRVIGDTEGRLLVESA